MYSVYESSATLVYLFSFIILGLMTLGNFLQIFLIFLPAFIANATPVIVKNIPALKPFSKPINEKFFGKNKTYRWLMTGIIAGMCTGGILVLLRSEIIWILPVYTDFYNLYTDFFVWILLWGILWLWALVGDMIKSLIKRKLGVPPGTMFQPWDGIDYMVGAIIFMIPWYMVGFSGWIFLLIIGPILSLASNTCSYILGWKECWY